MSTATATAASNTATPPAPAEQPPPLPSPPPPLTTTPRTANPAHRDSSNSNASSAAGAGGRPPKKPAGIPFGSSGPSTESNGGGASGSNNNNLMRDISERSRASLKETVFRRRSSLTAAEASFLLELLERGDEIEVQVAHENLLDEELFFPVTLEQQQQQNYYFGSSAMLDDSETGWRSDLIQVGRERDFSTHSLGDGSNSNLPPIEITNLQKVLNHAGSSSSAGGNAAGEQSLTASHGGGGGEHRTAASPSPNSNNMGSERRLRALQERRSSLLHGKMWKAHETGLAVSSHASQRSVQARHRSLLWQQQQNQNQQTDTIFRQTAAASNHSSSNNKATMDDTKSDNLPRRTGGNGLRNGSLSSSGHQHRKPVLRRMQSEGSRKSVTFARIPKPQQRLGSAAPMRDDSIGSVGDVTGGDGGYERRNSVGSIPSIHHGHLVWTSPYEPGRPYERSNSIGSVPSIHHAHPIGSPFERRNSMESVGSYTRRRGSIGSQGGEQYYCDRRDSMGSIPSIHHGHPVVTAPYERVRPYERSQSIGSLPSLHHGHPVSSPRSSASNTTGVPSLHHAHSVHSTAVLRHDDTEASDITASENVVAYDGDFFLADEKKTGDTTAPPPPAIREVVIPTDQKSRLDQQQLLDATKLLHTSDPDAPHQLLLDGLSKSGSSDIVVAPPQRPTVGRPVLMREASSNNYKGEGVEVADWLTERSQASFDRLIEPAASVGESLVSFGDGLSSIKTSNSFDERMSYRRVGSIFRRAMNRRRSMSEDSAPHAGIILGGNRLLIRESSSVKDLVPTDDDSWKLGDDDEDYYDSWKVIEDEYANGYGGGGTLPFRILGTSADDVDAHPHVLSPPLMESLQAFLPASQTGSNFWMKYSLVRDGASMHTFLQYARGAKYSILAIETLEGEVFGAFTAEPWRKNWNYFGSGESFLWRMRKSRREKCHSIIDQAQMESEIDVYPFTGANHCIQLCTHDKIAVGGGNMEHSSPASSPEKQQKGSKGSTGVMQRNEQLEVSESLSNDSYQIPDHAWGFGLTVEGDFLHGTTSPCLTFASPSLSTEHPRGDVFEIINLELYTLTPCDRLEDAEKLELGKLFLEKHTPKM